MICCDECRRHDFEPRTVKSAIIFGSRNELPEKTPAQYPLTEVLFFDELLELLSQYHPESPLLPALAPLNEPLNALETGASQHYASIREAPGLSDNDREILVEIYLNLLLQRFKTKNRDEIRTMIAELTQIKETRVGQELLEEGREEGREESQDSIIRTMAAKGMSASAISELIDCPLDRVERVVSQIS